METWEKSFVGNIGDIIQHYGHIQENMDAWVFGKPWME